MKTFPLYLDVRYKDKLSQFNYERHKQILRREIHDHMLNHKEDEYFSLDIFLDRLSDRNIAIRIIDEVIEELKKYGWKCQKSFGGTGLFIYSDTKPANLYEEM